MLSAAKIADLPGQGRYCWTSDDFQPCRAADRPPPAGKRHPGLTRLEFDRLSGFAGEVSEQMLRSLPLTDDFLPSVDDHGALDGVD